MLSSKPENRFSFPLRSPSRELTILLVEDSESDAYAVQRILGTHMPCPCHILHVCTLEEAELMLASRDDIELVLLDLGLPDSAGSEETYSRLEQYKDSVPIIVLTSVEDNNLAVEMLGVGAQDYVYKNTVSRDPETLCRNIQFAIGRHHMAMESRMKMAAQIAEKDDLLKMVTGSYSVLH